MSTVVRGLVYSLFFSMMGIGYGQPPASPYPDSYQTVESWGDLPNGRVWGATSAVYPASDGRGNIWVAERCGQNDCAGSEDVAPILLFSAWVKSSEALEKGYLLGLTVFLSTETIMFG